MSHPFNLHWDAPGDFEVRMHAGTIMSLTARPNGDDDQSGTIHFLRWYAMKVGGGRDNLWQGEFNHVASGPVELSFTIIPNGATVGIYIPSIGNAIAHGNQPQTFTFNRTTRGRVELKVTEGEDQPEKGA